MTIFAKAEYCGFYVNAVIYPGQGLRKSSTELWVRDECGSKEDFDRHYLNQLKTESTMSCEMAKTHEEAKKHCADLTSQFSRESASQQASLQRSQYHSNKSAQ